MHSKQIHSPLASIFFTAAWFLCSLIGACPLLAQENDAEDLKTLSDAQYDALMQKDYDKGIRIGKEILSRWPHEAPAMYNIACAYSLTNNKDEAIAWLEKVVETDPVFVPAGLMVDEDLRPLWNDERFKKLVEKTQPVPRGFNPPGETNQQSDARRIRGELLEMVVAFRGKEYSAALKSAKTALSIQDDAFLHYQVAIINGLLNDKDAVLRHLREYVKHGPSACNAYEQLSNETAFDAFRKEPEFQAISKDVQSISAAPSNNEPQIYWLDAGFRWLARAPISMRCFESLAPFEGEMTDLVLDPSERKMYWRSVVGSVRGSILRANLDGSAMETIIEEVDGAMTIDLVSRRIYWAGLERGIIRMAPLVKDRSEMARQTEQLMVTQCKEIVAMAIDSKRGRLFWGDASKAIYSARLDDRTPITVRSEQYIYPKGMAVDPTSGDLIFVNSVTGSIHRCSADGQNFRTLIEKRLQYPLGISLDLPRRKMYWTTRGQIQRASLDGTQESITASIEDVTTIQTISAASVAILVDSTTPKTAAN